MSNIITHFKSPIQKDVKITSNTSKNDDSQFKDQKPKKCSVVLKDFFEKIQYVDFNNLKFGPDVNNSAKIIPQNQKARSEQKEDSKLKVENYEKKCEACNKIFTDGTKFHKHKCSFKCQLCDSKFSYRRDLIKHMKNRHQKNNSNMKCHFCSDYFISNSRDLDPHTKKHFRKKSEQFECDFCGKFFLTKVKLAYHMRVHLSKVNCSICQAVLARNALDCHLRNFHAKGTNFQCQICEKAFKCKKSLSNHEKLHDKKFECKLCNKKFSRNSVFKEHMNQYHLNPNSYPCDVCDKKFNRKDRLNGHKKVHNKNHPKPFKCQRCDYASDSNRSYQKHIKVHQRQDEKVAAMEAPLICEKCSAFCRNKKVLLNHMNQVHPKELFQCDLCGIYIKTKHSLSRHIKRFLKNKINQ